MNSIKTIFWDFDGVILDSNSIRTFGFKEVLKKYPKHEVDSLLEYHELNGGLSRYVKFRYFFESIRKESISDFEINILAERFSKVIFSKLVCKDLLITDSNKYIRENYKNIQMFIVSGSDEIELNQICIKLNLVDYFKEIKGSPIEKKELVRQLIFKYGINIENSLLIGDSLNDFEAAQSNKISFMGFGNTFISNYSNIKLF